MPPPTIIDVARASKVSPSTVSLVISDHPRIPSSTKERVLKKIRELNYRPNILARSLANGHTRIIAVLIPPAENIFSDPFYIQALDGIYSVARQKGYRIILEVATEDFWKNKEYQRIARERLSEGIVFVGGIASEHKTLACFAASKEGIPVSVVGEKLPPLSRSGRKTKFPADRMFFVSGDNFKGGYIATKYLIDLGHKRIAHIYGDMSVNSVRERFNGYKHALNEAGIKYDNRLVVAGRFKEIDSYLGMKKLLQSPIGKNLTAVFAGNDIMAYGAILAAKEVGFSVPESFSVVGMDDAPSSADFNPPLTTVKYPVFAMGSQGVLWLIDNIEKKYPPAGGQEVDKRGLQTEISLDVALVVRKSATVCQ